MTVYTWDGGGSDDLWTNADNWDANGIPADETSSDTINFPTGVTVDIGGLDQSGFTNGIGNIQPAGPLTITASSGFYFKQNTQRRIFAPSAAGDCVIKIGTDLDNGAAFNGTFDVDPITTAGWLDTNQTGSTERRVRAEIYDSHGWVKRHGFVTAANGTNTVTLDDVPDIMAVGRRVELVQNSRTYQTTISGISGNVVTLAGDYSTEIPSGNLANGIRGGLALYDIQSNIVIDAKGATNSRLTGGSNNSVFCCEIRGFNTVFDSGNVAHIHSNFVYGPVHHIQSAQTNGSQCVFAGIVIGGNADQTDGGEGLNAINSTKGHIWGLDKDKSVFANFVRANNKVTGNTTGNVAGSGDRSFNCSVVECKELIESDNLAEANNLSDTGLVQWHVPFLGVRGLFGVYARPTNQRVFTSTYPDEIDEMFCKRTYPIIRPVVDEPPYFMRINKLTFLDPRQTTYGDLRDVIDYANKTARSGAEYIGVAVRNASILLSQSGTPTLYDYWLERGEAMGRVTQGVAAAPLAGAPSGMTNPAKFEFFAGTPDLFLEQSVYLSAGESVSIAWEVHLIDSFDYQPFLYISPWISRPDVQMIDRNNPTAPLNGYVSAAAASTTGVTQSFTYNFTAPVAARYHIGVHNHGGSNENTLSATKTMWATLTASASGGGSGGSEGLVDQNLLIDDTALLRAG